MSRCYCYRITKGLLPEAEIQHYYLKVMGYITFSEEQDQHH